jgi:hypothetical protein
MNTEPHKPAESAGEVPRNSDVSFEERDVRVSTIYWYLFALGLATAAALVICIFILRFTTNLAASSDPAPPPSREAQSKDFRMPPEPRLQGVPGHENDPQKDLRQKLKADMDANEKLEWLDKNAGIAQIPVKEAMKIIAEKGLPAVSGPPAEKKK